MKFIVITGANKGIGLAVVEAILREQTQYAVILGSRDRGRGEAARNELLAIDPAWSDRVEVFELDVSSDRSVSLAAERIAERREGDSLRLAGLVNNAGAINGSIAEVLEVNAYGIRRMCRAFAPLIEEGGRIVNVTSASGPNFVARCDADRQAFFTDETMTWERLDAFMQQCTGLRSLDTLGMGGGAAYGLSKACANVLTIHLAKQYPDLVVNACTPGYIDTDLGRETLGSRTPEEAGMKAPADGARAIMKLLFETPRGVGHYYGSDGLRSPMDHYRAPGSPEFTGT